MNFWSPSIIRSAALVVLSGFLLTACSTSDPAPTPESPAAGEERSWAQILEAADGQQVRLWMWGGDPRGNAYVDEHLIPAAAQRGIELTRVPIADTKDAINRLLDERAAGVTEGSVDLVWVNGENFAAGVDAELWWCGWVEDLPNAAVLDSSDPVLTSDFGRSVDDCEAPWHRAQFAFVYNQDTVTDPPTSVDDLLQWIEENPGRFTYPAPPDFTGSAFLRHLLYYEAGGVDQVPPRFSESAYDELTPDLWARLDRLSDSLWRAGQTYPNDVGQLDSLFADGQVDFTMTYGPATLTDLVARGVFPAGTRVLDLQEGTIGNASFLAIPASSGAKEAAQVVVDLALSPEQQATKADPRVWGQFTVVDLDRLDESDRELFDRLPTSPVVPPLTELTRNAAPELGTGWVPALENGWRENVLQ